MKSCITCISAGTIRSDWTSICMTFQRQVSLMNKYSAISGRYVASCLLHIYFQSVTPHHLHLYIPYLYGIKMSSVILNTFRHYRKVKCDVAAFIRNPSVLMISTNNVRPTSLQHSSCRARLLNTYSIYRLYIFKQNNTSQLAWIYWNDI
jgi:hypothetical protein